MSYVDAFIERDSDTIKVVERVNGERKFSEHPVPYEFFYEDAKGKFKSIFRTPLTRVTCKSNSEFQKEKRILSSKKLFESDMNPIFKLLSSQYLGVADPKLHTCFLDIEVDWCPKRGFAPPNDPFNKVTAVTLYLDWCETLATIAIPPKAMTLAEAKAAVEGLPNVVLVDNERDMFEHMFTLIEDSDVITGWNSEGFDVPYLVNRITKVMGKEYTKNFCLWGQYPKARKYERFGNEETTYDFIGRVHLDYLQLYKKYNYESRHSYSLNAIGELELGDVKVEYEGSLDQLYNNDFRKFIEYNQKDVTLLYRIHAKLQFLDLANTIAHENTVLLPTVMGSVAMIEQAVVNEAHSRGLRVHDKKRGVVSAGTAAGAYVANPKKGTHRDIGAVDFSSLYPNIIRSLNMDPATIVAQIRPTLTDALMQQKAKNGVTGPALWEDMFSVVEFEAVHSRDPGKMLIVDYEDGKSEELSAAQIWDKVFNSYSPLMLSANGTIFSYEHEGVIPGLLSRWFKERKELQAKESAAETPEDRAFWHKRQLVKKIMLNSAYGSLLNEHCRFYDRRIGQSVTLSGRQAVRHMMSNINEQVMGDYDHTGPAVLYGDTDSTYFTAWPAVKQSVESGEMEWNKDICISLYDSIGEGVNASMPGFMLKTFHTPTKNCHMKAARELVADRGIFISKKRYALNQVDKDGKRLDVNNKPGKIKAMGLDLRRSDTPKFVQRFLSELLEMLLQQGKEKEDVIQRIKDFRTEFRAMDPWMIGSPKAVNGLTGYAAKQLESKSTKFETAEKTQMPGHVRASLNWNYLRGVYGDKHSMEITDGAKVTVCALKPNPMGFTSIAWPVDEKRLPHWLKELPFDVSLMEEKLIDQKVDNLLGELHWNLQSATKTSETLNNLFSFGEQEEVIPVTQVHPKKQKPAAPENPLFSFE